VLVHLAPFHHGPGIGALRRAELPPSIPTLADLYEHCGTAFELSLDMGQPRAVEAVIDVATRAGALDRLWLTYWRTDTLARWRERWPDVHLVYPTIPLSPGRARSVAGDLAEIGVDALNLYHPFCTAGAVQRAHEYGLLVFAWGLKRPGGLKRVLRQQVDGVFGDDVEVMVRAAH
jgi:glycerophosphoryl diester phosphodiesterase